MVALAFVALSCLSLTTTTKNLQMSVETTASTSTRKPTLRSISSSLSDDSFLQGQTLSSRASAMNARASQGTPLTEEELDGIVHSLQNLQPPSSADDKGMDYEKLTTLLQQVAHLSHKDWSVTGENARRLGQILLGANNSLETAASTRQVLERILREGNWQGAAKHAVENPELPWAVLVTGVNGIRKTTSLYQDWFPALLQEALIAPKADADDAQPPKRQKTAVDFDAAVLPSGKNSFFRQLDHMIATLCNEEFAALYALTASAAAAEQQDDDNTTPSEELVNQYSDLKAAIFTRYRTLSELLGAFLLEQAQTLKLNCLLETSGRDVAMFHYVDHFFSNGTTRKLALHFTINDLQFAQESVDKRMVGEMAVGQEALAAEDAFRVVYANAGGPYGSHVLPSVQEASDRVWKEQVLTGAVGADWYKATIHIEASRDEPWTAQAVRPDGSLGTKYTFKR